MATPSAAQVFTGVSGSRADGTGSAVVLDQAQDFQPIADAFYRKREAEQVRRAAEQKKADQDWFNLQKGFDPEAVALRDQDEMMSRADEFNNMLVELRMSGADPKDYYSEAGKKARQKEFELKNLKKASDENQKYDALVAAALEKKDPSMDRAYAVDWLKRYRALPSIEAQAKMRQEESPFKTVYSFDQTIDRVKPFTKDVLVEKGNRTDQISGLNEDAYRAKVRLDLQTPAGQTDFELWSNTKGNEGKTATDYENELVEYAKGAVKESIKTTYDEPKVTSSGGSGGGITFNSDGSVTTDKVVIRPDFIDTTGVSKNTNYNVARVVRTGTQDDLPPVETYSETGELIDFRPVEFVLGANGKIGVKGIKIQRKENSDGTITFQPKTDSGGKPEEVWVDYDRNKALFEGQTGVDMYKVFGKQKSGETKQNSGVIEITTKEEFDKLTPGTEFIYKGQKKVKG
jgi:hypothetical protein